MSLPRPRHLRRCDTRANICSFSRNVQCNPLLILFAGCQKVVEVESSSEEESSDEEEVVVVTNGKGAAKVFYFISRKKPWGLTNGAPSKSTSVFYDERQLIN